MGLGKIGHSGYATTLIRQLIDGRPKLHPHSGSLIAVKIAVPGLRWNPACGLRHHPAGMFVVTEAEAAAIRAVFEQLGEFAAAVELRRLFPRITDMAAARECARTVAGWKPVPVRLRQWTRRESGQEPAAPVANPCSSSGVSAATLIAGAHRQRGQCTLDNSCWTNPLRGRSDQPCT